MKKVIQSINKNKINYVIILLSMVIYFILAKEQMIQYLSINDESMRFNLLTINSIFAGFLFTGLGIIIGGLDNTEVTRLNNSGYMDKRFNAIYLGMFFAICSMIISISFLFFKIPGEQNQIVLILTKLEIYTSLMGVVFFSKSMYDVASIVKKLRKKQN